MSNPSVTFRCSPQDRKRLDELVAKTGKSRGKLLRENLGIAERDESATYDKGLSDGINSGYETGLEYGKVLGMKAARNTLAIKCPRCGKTMIFDLAANDWRLWRALVRMDVLNAYVCGECASK